MHRLSFVKSKFIENSMWLIALQVFNTVVPMITLPYVTRVLNPSAYGDFSLGLNIALYFQVLVEYGFGFWGSRIVAAKLYKDLNKIYSSIMEARTVLMIISMIAVFVVTKLMNLSNQQNMTLWILLLMVFPMIIQQTWIFQGMQDMKFIALINATARFTSVILVFVLVKNSSDVYLYSFLYSFTFLLSGILGVVVSKKKFGVRFKFVGVHTVFSILKKAWPLFISQAMGKVLSGVGITILGFVATSASIGAYSAIYKIPYVLVMLFYPVSQAMFPDVAAKFQISYRQGVNRVKQISKVIIPLVVGAAIVLIVFRRQIVFIAFGSDYLSQMDLIVPLSLWAVFSILNNLIGVQLLIASGKQRLYSSIFTFSAFIAIVISFFCGYIYKTNGVAWGTLVSEVILSILLFVGFKKSKNRGVK